MRFRGVLASFRPDVLSNTILFRCCDAATPFVQLQRWRRCTMAVVTTWLTAIGGMLEAVAEFLLVGHSTFSMVAMFAFATLALLLAIPAIVLIPVVGEFERELAERNSLPPNYESLEKRVPQYMVRILVAAIALAGLLHIFC
ncbi:MAG TPA: hypothetical protein VK797_09860 [Tepidisphaeraceae bacterium]|jgi:hypothetical protein|nr:hypothetical protein [Tepidisphaeraceae bacterium]